MRVGYDNAVTSKDLMHLCFIIRSIEPINCTGSILLSVTDSLTGNMMFNNLVETYFEQMVDLMDSNTVMLVVKIIFNTLNVKTVLYEIGEYLVFMGLDILVFILGILVDQLDCTLLDQTGKALYTSLRHTNFTCVCINYGLGVMQMIPFLERHHKCVDCFTRVYPND